MLIRSLGFAIAALSVATSSFAQSLTLPPETTHLTPIKGQVTAVQPVRFPLGPATTGVETRVTLKFTLQGCLDSLMPLITHSETQGEQATIYVTALNAHSQASKVANCRAMPQKTAQVKVPGVFQRNQLRVVFLGQPPQQP